MAERHAGIGLGRAAACSSEGPLGQAALNRGGSHAPQGGNQTGFGLPRPGVATEYDQMGSIHRVCGCPALSVRRVGCCRSLRPFIYHIQPLMYILKTMAATIKNNHCLKKALTPMRSLG
jgi:hypothetical protein